MPRETIHPSTPPTEGGGPAFELVVAWAKDQDVRVGIETRTQADGQHHLVDHIYAGEQANIGRHLWAQLSNQGDLTMRDFRDSTEEADFMETFGRAILDAVTGSTPFGTGVWVDLDRRQLNEALRKMKRAGASAYGRDEW